MIWNDPAADKAYYKYETCKKVKCL